MEIKENHLRIGDYIIQFNRTANYFGECTEGFVVLDTTQDNAQVGDEYDHVFDAIEQVLKY